MSGPVLTEAECRTLGERIFHRLAKGRGSVSIYGGVTAWTDFARGEIRRASDSVTRQAYLTVDVDGHIASVSTSRLDDEGLDLLVKQAEAAAREQQGAGEPMRILGRQEYLDPPPLYADSTVRAMDAASRMAVCRRALDAGEAANLIGAGWIYHASGASVRMDTGGLFAYSRGTGNELSLVMRTRDGTGSGWAQAISLDWSRVDVEHTVARAVDLGRRSANPVAVEPGRYTVILEPAVVGAFLLGLNLYGPSADEGRSPFSKDPIGSNKIGLKVMDERLWLTCDPWDPDYPHPTFDPNSGEPIAKVVWVKRGVLQNLNFPRAYAQSKGRDPVFYAMPGNNRLYAEGSLQTLDEMIASTKRGIWVNRISEAVPMNRRTGLVSGTTRDGTFLIENGKITKSVKNFRFTEAMLFILNKVEAVGESVRAGMFNVAPRLKVRDFDFTSLTDAV